MKAPSTKRLRSLLAGINEDDISSDDPNPDSDTGVAPVPLESVRTAVVAHESAVAVVQATEAGPMAVAVAEPAGACAPPTLAGACL